MSRKIVYCSSIALLLAILLALNSLNNSCDNYLSYFNIYFSPHCYHNPDVNKEVSEIIRRHIGVCEIHQVRTEDGYILGLFRIPQENPKGVILFQHPIFTDARMWVAQSEQSIAFLFWKAGYDVWLASSRGTFYSKKHESLEPSDPKFWNYSLDEMGYYDNSALIEFVKKRTNRSKIIYFGMSMGATTGLIYACKRAEDAEESLQMIVAIAPCTSFVHSKGGLKYVRKLQPLFQRYFEYAGVYSLMKHDSWYMRVRRNFYMHFPFKIFVPLMRSLFTGGSPLETDPNYANLMMAQHGSEIAVKVMDHFHQFYASNGTFQMFDYGEEENLARYGQRKPPRYQVQNIKLPVFLVYSQNDYFCAPQDNDALYHSLSEEAKIYGKLVVEGLGHTDFIHGKRRNKKVYNKILQMLDELEIR